MVNSEWIGQVGEQLPLSATAGVAAADKNNNGSLYLSVIGGEKNTNKYL